MQGGGEDVVRAVRGAVGEDGGGGPGVVALDSSFGGGEEGGAGHNFFVSFVGGSWTVGRLMYVDERTGLLEAVYLCGRPSAPNEFLWA